MRDLRGLFALPPSLLTLALLSRPAVQAQLLPFNLQPHEKYFPEHEAYLEKNWRIQQKLEQQSPAGVRKMSEDEGEKFFLDFWDMSSLNIPAIPVNVPVSRGYPDCTEKGDLDQANHVAWKALLPSFPLHADAHEPDSLSSLVLGRSIFERDYQCPSGTTSCTIIGQPDSCCLNGETCISVQDTGLGPVGCCPAGETCGGSVSSCDTAQGYSSCPGSSNGGCCIPGYSCQDVGCVFVGTETTTTSLPTTTVTSASTISNEPASSGTTTTETEAVTAASVPVSPSVQTVTTTVIISRTSSAEPTTVTQTMTITPSTNPATSTTLLTQSQLSCRTGFSTCPASLGGGCCPTDRACGSPTCPPLSSTVSAVAPIRPTSVSDSTQTDTTTAGAATTASPTTTSAATGSVCPTGFYMCSAYYLGGCCRVGRNCDTTSCPSSASTSVIDTSGLTIAAPAGASSASADTSGAAGVLTITSTTTPGSSASQGSCANGWLSCAASVGGGCCPSGYVCGTSCSATISGESNVGKESPSDAAKVTFMGWSFCVFGAAIGAAMVVL